MPLSISIDVESPSLGKRIWRRAEGAGRWLRALVAGAPLPSYTQTREELGGMPWRRLLHSDAWFVSQVGMPADAGDLDEPLPSITVPSMGRERSAPFKVREPSVAFVALDETPDLRTPLVPRRALAFCGGAAALALVSFVVFARASAPVPIPSLAPMPVASAPSAIPATPAPTPVPVVAAPPATAIVPHAAKKPALRKAQIARAKHKLARARTRAHRG